MYKEKVCPGYSYCYAIKADNTLVAAGYNSSYYCCGQGNTSTVTYPTKVNTPGNEQIDHISQGLSYHKLFLTKSGKVLGVGYNANYGMGDGTNSYYQTIRELQFFTKFKGQVKKVVTGYLNSYVILKNGKMYVFGYNYYGKLGNGNATDIRNPYLISLNNEKIVDTAGACYHSLLCCESGAVYTTGQGSNGQLGHGSTSAVNRWQKVQYFNSIKIKSVHCGYGNFSFFLSRDSKVYGCGYNTCGVLGTGSGTNSNVSTPACVQALSGKKIVRIRCGQSHAVFISQKGDVYFTGSGGSYQRGQGNTSSLSTPTLFNGSSYIQGKIVDVFCSMNSSFFVTKKGEVYSCGSNSSGCCLQGSTGTKSTIAKTSVVVRIEPDAGSSYQDYSKLIKDKMGNIGQSSRMKKEFFEIKFKNKKDVLSVSVTTASFISSVFSAMIEKGKKKMKMEEVSFEPMKMILAWVDNKKSGLNFKSLKEMKVVYFTAKKWKINEVSLEICKALEKETDMKKIIDILFDLDEQRQNNNALFHQCKLVFKKNYQSIITTSIGYLVQKKTAKTTGLYTYLLSTIISEDLEKLEKMKEFSDDKSDDGVGVVVKSKLFDEKYKDVAFKCNDGKFIMAHKEIVMGNQYLAALLRSTSSSVVFVDLPSKILLFIIIFVYKEKIDIYELDLCVLQELVVLKSEADEYGLPDLKQMVQKRIDSYDLSWISKEDLAKSVVNIQEQLLELMKKFKEFEGLSMGDDSTMSGVTDTLQTSGDVILTSGTTL